jgi:UDP-4-amino-4-deoxy-L-arabinose formyltransferase/UDP-glucuronic acid dehydrogenase (UDP-4-keto-hexauronic acid decarboxylating)
MNILLVAEESAGIQVLRMVADSGHRLVAVMTAPPTRGGGATVASVAETLDVPILPSTSVRDPKVAGWMRTEEIDLLLNVHSLYVIHGDLVAAPRIGSFNLHPGPLPEYAGLNAPSWAIYRGEQRHAVTVHWMEAGIDTGAIAFESSFEITEDDTGLSLSARCVREGLPLFSRLLEAAEQGREAVPATPQDLSRRSYYGSEVPNDGRIEWSRPARKVVDFVRACDYFPFPSPWGQPRARLDGRAVGVIKASRTREQAGTEPGTVGSAAEDGVRVAAEDEWILVHRLQLEGKGVPAGTVLEPGMHLDDGD